MEESSLKNFECVVCLETCEKCINCIKCNNLMCLKHVKDIQNKCPYCREQPFKYQENIPMQRIIASLLESYKLKHQLVCKVRGCDYKGQQAEFLQHAVAQHAELIVKTCTNEASQENKNSNTIVKSKAAKDENEDLVQQLQQLELQVNARDFISDLVDHRHIASVENNRPAPPTFTKTPISNRPNQMKKVPTSEHYQLMLEHSQGCANQQCLKLWSGIWGPFIGGIQGSTHFDLTDCPIGKVLNQQAGWDYNDPTK